MTPDDPTGDIRVTRPIRSPAGWDQRTDGPRPAGLLRPFTGLLGSWQPSIDGLPPRLSFLSLPWLVREVYTTERVVPDEREDEPTLTGDVTAETTTVSRLLRSDDGVAGGRSTASPVQGDDPTGETASRTVVDLHEVLRWRPILGSRRTPPAWTVERPRESDETASRPPSLVPRTFRTAPDAGRVDEREGRQEPGRTGDEHTREHDQRSVTTARTGVEAVPESLVGAAWPTDAVGIRATGEFQPTLSTIGARPMHHRFRQGAPTAAGDISGHDRSVMSGTTRPGASRGRDAEPTTVDGSVWPELALPGGAAVWTPGAGRPVETDPSSRRSSSSSTPEVDADAGRGVALTYRRADVQTTGAARQFASRSTGTPTAGTQWPTGSRGGPHPDVETSEPSHVATEPTLSSRAYASDDAPTSPFASFPSTDAAIDHVYHDFERRLRIERERRGL